MAGCKDKNTVWEPSGRPIRVIASSSDGAYLAAGSDLIGPNRNNTVALWKNGLGTPPELFSTEDLVNTLVFDSGNRYLFAGGNFESLFVADLDVADSSLIGGFDAKRVVAMASCRTQDLLAIATSTNDWPGSLENLALYEAGNPPELLKSLPINQKGTTVSLHFDRDCQRLAIVSVNQAMLLTLEEAVVLKTVESRAVTAGALSSDGRFLAIGTAFGVLEVHDLENGANNKIVSAHSGPINALEFLPNERLVSAGEDLGLKLWDSVSAKLIGNLAASGKMITAIQALSLPANTHVVTGDEIGQIEVWNLRGDQLTLLK